MTTASIAARIAWIATVERAAALSETALPAWESLDEAARAQLEVDAGLAFASGSVLGEFFGQWSASRAGDGWTYGAAEDFAAKTSPMLTDAAALTESQVARLTLWHSVCRACWRSLA